MVSIKCSYSLNEASYYNGIVTQVTFVSPDAINSEQTSCQNSKVYAAVGEQVTLSCTVSTLSITPVPLTPSSGTYALFIGSYQVTPSFNSLPIIFTAMRDMIGGISQPVYLQTTSPLGSVRMQSLISLDITADPMSWSVRYQETENNISINKKIPL